MLTCRISQRSLIPRIVKTVLVVAASTMFLSDHVAAQTFKCTDEGRKITYSNTKCSVLGLKDAGEVRDRINVHSAFKPPAQAEKPQNAPDPPAKADAMNTSPAPQKPAEPERRCINVMTKKGPVTTCEDKLAQ